MKVFGEELRPQYRFVKRWSSVKRWSRDSTADVLNANYEMIHSTLT